MRRVSALVAILAMFSAAAELRAEGQPNLPAGLAGSIEAAQKQMTAKFDTNGDGQLSDAEKAAATAEMQKFVAAIDKNGNGKIDPEEAAMAKALMSRPGQGGAPKVGAGGFAAAAAAAGGFGGTGGGGFGGQIPPDLLAKFDKNGDGQFDEKEQKAAGEALGPKKSRKAKLLEKLDKDGDGKISKEEREAAAAEYKAEQEAKKAKAKSK